MGTITFCKYDTETVDLIHDWCTTHNIPNPTGRSKIHTSVIWSRTDVPREHWLERDASHFRKMSFKATGLALFDHWSKREEVMQKCLVIKLNAPYLVHCHKHMLKNGGSYGFLEYVPHVTVCYNFPEDRDITGLPTPTFEFKPNKIFSETFIPPPIKK